ncbi:hypothetical protein HK098_004133 [Nowakowskiella sp. JEL0407]|nr:hypothetical protein HK098_004133 [Nowakowskiella sp. JEL0407]
MISPTRKRIQIVSSDEEDNQDSSPTQQQNPQKEIPSDDEEEEVTMIKEASAINPLRSNWALQSPNSSPSPVIVISDSEKSDTNNRSSPDTFEELFEAVNKRKSTSDTRSLRSTKRLKRENSPLPSSPPTSRRPKRSVTQKRKVEVKRSKRTRQYKRETPGERAMKLGGFLASDDESESGSAESASNVDSDDERGKDDDDEIEVSDSELEFLGIADNDNSATRQTRSATGRGDNRRKNNKDLLRKLRQKSNVVLSDSEDDDGDPEDSNAPFDPESEDLDQDIEGFVEEDDPSSRKFVLPAMFRSANTEELILVLLQYLVNVTLNPKFGVDIYDDDVEETGSNAEYFRFALDTINNRLQGFKDSLVSSTAWKFDFKDAKITIPDTDIENESDTESVSDLEDLWIDEEFQQYEDDDDHADYLKKDDKENTFVVGRFCYRRAMLYHKLHHAMYYFRQMVLKEMKEVAFRRGLLVPKVIGRKLTVAEERRQLEVANIYMEELREGDMVDMVKEKFIAIGGSDIQLIFFVQLRTQYEELLERATNYADEGGSRSRFK